MIESEEEKKIEIKRANIELDNVYRSCCLVIDRRAVLFFTQLSFSVFVLGFSAYHLSENDQDCSRTHLYTGLLTLILGWWAPSPSLK